jgi:LAO/AO transport system kinase
VIPADLLSRVASGDRRALARALTLAESGASTAAEGAGRRPRRVAITGPPGAGKSTLVAALIGEIRARKLTVGVLAVDPSSPFSGGALLGDRIRMARHSLDEGVFIRSQASRGASGGLAPSTHALLDVLDLAGFDLVLLETVGAGQADLDGVNVTDFAVVVLAPQMGDGVQAMKAGLIEAADVIVVNKGDLGGADTVRNDLLSAFELSARGPKEVLICSARDGSGVGALLDAILAMPGAELDRKRAARASSRKAAPA